MANRAKRLELLERQAQATGSWSGGVNPAGYPGDPVAYARNVLGVTLSPDQETILKHLLIPPCRVMVPSAHDTGKTFCAAVATNWWYDSFNPGVVITTAPTKRDVEDLLWAEVRMQRQRAGLPLDFIGPSAPEMRTSEDHYAKGFTAVKGESFAGRHRERMLFIKDEATGVDSIYWITTKTMFDPGLGHAELNIYNPTDSTSAAYHWENASEPDGTPRYHVFRLSALNHPNVLADLRGEPRPIPGAVNRAMVDEWVVDWCEPVPAESRVGTDIEWPPGSGKWYKPGPIFQCRALGVWPDTGTGVWSDALFAACLDRACPPVPVRLLPEVGCDTATGKGDDSITIHARWGDISLHHESANTMDPAKVYGSLKVVCRNLADLVNAYRERGGEPVTPQDIKIKIDDDGTGNAIVAFLRRDGYCCAPVGAGWKALHSEEYPRMRDELWFQVAGRARLGGLYLGGFPAARRFGLSGLDDGARRRIKQQLMAPAWDMDVRGRRRVERKEVTKAKIGRSPDDANGLNLAYLEGMVHDDVPTIIPDPEQRRNVAEGWQERMSHSHACERGLFGRGHGPPGHHHHRGFLGR
jgi:hypothetical protein